MTALAPHIGYAATAPARQALATGRGVKDLAAETGLLTTGELETILRPENLTGQAPVPDAPAVLRAWKPCCGPGNG